MTDRETVEAQLLERLATLTRRVAQTDRDLREPLEADFEEQATTLESRDTLETIEMAELREIEAVRAALARLEAGTYETCQSCGEPIGDRRLAALPTASVCIDCAKKS